MARTGRPKHAIPRTRWDVYIRTDLAAKVELIVSDPLRDKAKYGARSAYLEGLVAKDLEQKMLAQGRGEIPHEPSDLQRFIHALEFEIDHWNLATPEVIRKLVADYKEKTKSG